MSISARAVTGSGTTGSIRQSDLGEGSSNHTDASPASTDRTAHPSGGGSARATTNATVPSVTAGQVIGTGSGHGPMSFNPTPTTAAPTTRVYDAVVSSTTTARNGRTETDATTADTSATATPTLAGGLGARSTASGGRPQMTTSPFATSNMTAPSVVQPQPLSSTLAAINPPTQQQMRPAQISVGGVGPSSGAPALLPVSAGPTHRRGRGSASASGGAATHLRYEPLLDDNHGGSSGAHEDERLLPSSGRGGGAAATSVASIVAKGQQPVLGGVVKSPLAPVAGGAISPAAVASGGASVVASIPLNAGPVPTKQLGPPVLVLKNISKSFAVDGGNEIIHALHSISLCEPDQADGFSFPAIRQGEFVMIRGPSGGGKTTLLNMVGTIDAPTKGTIELMGEKITKDSPDTYLADLRLRRIGFVFQTFNLLPTMSALENVELPMTLVGKLNEQERRSRAKQLLALVGLRNRVHHLPSELSGGEQQRVTIARALANNPDLLLLDEPTGDLDTATTIQVMDLLLQINCMSGTTCIMVTHNPDVECYADRILYVADGRFVRQAVNTRPVPLVRDDYEEYLKEMERRQTQLMLNRNQEGNVKPTATNMASVEF